MPIDFCFLYLVFILSAAKRIWFVLVVIIFEREGGPVSMFILFVLGIFMSSLIIIVSLGVGLVTVKSINGSVFVLSRLLCF